MPDYPSKTTTARRLNYPRMLWSIFVMLVTKPALFQAGLAACCMSAFFTSYWTNHPLLPAVLAAVHLRPAGDWAVRPLVIRWGPPFGRIVLDRLTPLVPALGGLVLNLVG
ncbi:hypothetical protein MAPG_04451 [Magnaporthiopsis poae ATCC 64411]|uniref:Uncharacterized protein n=1 Tax=Magnaporthiopsis poae (strain ATCC 64411 / 73-15) TaxID=644358 RepID=A0A0C4DWS1_MAGP6|nr:hypothetical protein MAPG_04451 [Magnaporthiopsis poae ATCC 64411]